MAKKPPTPRRKPSSDDPFDSPEFRAYAARVRAELVPMIQASAVTVSLVPRGDADVKYAVELGLSIMLSKPIIAVVRPGVQVPEKLVRVADRIIEADLGTETGKAKTAEAIRTVIEELEQ